MNCCYGEKGTSLVGEEVPVEAVEVLEAVVLEDNKGRRNNKNVVVKLVCTVYFIKFLFCTRVYFNKILKTNFIGSFRFGT